MSFQDTNCQQFIELFLKILIFKNQRAIFKKILLQSVNNTNDGIRSNSIMFESENNRKPKDPRFTPRPGESFKNIEVSIKQTISAELSLEHKLLKIQTRDFHKPKTVFDVEAFVPNRKWHQEKNFTFKTSQTRKDSMTLLTWLTSVWDDSLKFIIYWEF